MANALACSTSCGEKCLFRLCNPTKFTTVLPKGSPVILRAPGQTGYPFICRNFTDQIILSTILNTGEALVQENTCSRQKTTQSRPGPIPISRWFPSSDHSFPSNFFEVGNIPLSLRLHRPVQGIIRTSTDEAQDSIIDNECVILPILSYAVADRMKKAIFPINFKNAVEENCVSFVVKTFDLVIDLTWNEARNLDLKVVGPKGETGVSINKESGVILTEETGNRGIGGQESVVYKNAPRGKYMVEVSGSSGRLMDQDTTDSRIGEPCCFDGEPPRRGMDPMAQLTVSLNSALFLEKKVNISNLNGVLQSIYFKV